MHFYTKLIHAVIIAFSLTMALVLGVVWLLFRVNADIDPSVLGQMDQTLRTVILFMALAISNGIAFWAIHKHKSQLFILMTELPVLLFISILVYLFVPSQTMRGIFGL